MQISRFTASKPDEKSICQPTTSFVRCYPNFKEATKMKKKSFAILLAAALLLCLLPGMAPEAKAETIRDKCRFCNTTADHEITRFERFNDDYHYVIYICSHCGKGSYALFDDNPIGRHSGGTETPTCTTGKTCTRCGTQYGKLGHDWGAWQSRGNNSEHFRTCQRDGCDAVDTASCSGDSSATCITLGTCTTCGGQYYSAHTFPANQGWDSDAENHWVSCTVCHEAKTKVGAHFFVQGNDSSCLKSAATCVSPPVYYTNCAYCYRKGTDTYVHPWYGPDPNNHDLVHHDAKAPTCTEIGWNAYDACQREGCTYTTKVEIPAPGHDYTEKVVKPTCGKGGYTLHTCKKCNDSYKDHQTKTLLHWYGEWTSNGDGTHSATCKRKDCKHVGKTECAIVEFKQAEATRTLCPVCGNVSDGIHLALVEEVKAEGEHLPYGELVLRMGETANGNTLLSVCFEVSGKLTQPKGEVKITLPAELLNGVTLALLNADDTEIDLPYIVEGENAVFTLDFTDAEIPTALIRLIPTAE